MEEHIHILIAKALSKEASAAELQELDMWLQEREENRTEYASIQDLWAQADTLWQQPQFNELAAWTKVSAQMQDIASEPARRIPFRRNLFRISAAAAAIVAIVFLYNIWGTEKMITVEATSAMAVTLPDQSRVNLRKGSTLSYPKHFDKKQRTVTLNGEAYFEVTHNEAQPFVVDAALVSVTVLGTTFYVACNNTTANVTVNTGKVRMAVHKAPAEQVILLPGNKGVYTGQGRPLHTETDTNAIYYRTGQMAFAGQGLEQVVTVLNKVKNTQILLAASLSAAARSQAINITFGEQTIEDMLTELCLISHTRWTKTGNQYLISAR